MIDLGAPVGGRRGRGFTLVEVMVALAIVAIALPALMFSLHQQIDGTGYLRDKSLAQMVATNKLTELRILTQARQALFTGKDNGVTELASRQWSWTVESTPAPAAESFYRVEINVREGDDESTVRAPIYTLVAYMSSELGIRETISQ